MKIGLHRALHYIHGENSFTGIKNIEHKIDFIELDFQLTKDGVLILHHDEYDKNDLIISENIHKDILIDKKKGSLNGKQVVDYIMNETDIGLNVEFKVSPFFGNKIDVEKYIEYFIDYPQERIFYSSFNSKLIYSLKQKFPEMEVGLLFESSFDLLNLKWELLDNLHPHWTVIEDELIDVCKKKKKKIITYTVNSRNIFVKLKNLDIYGIITNHPDLIN